MAVDSVLCASWLAIQVSAIFAPASRSTLAASVLRPFRRFVAGDGLSLISSSSSSFFMVCLFLLREKFGSCLTSSATGALFVVEDILRDFFGSLARATFCIRSSAFFAAASDPRLVDAERMVRVAIAGTIREASPRGNVIDDVEQYSEDVNQFRRTLGVVLLEWRTHLQPRLWRREKPNREYVLENTPLDGLCARKNIARIVLKNKIC